ncbi:MAG TPA: hotdog fold thioesterase [Roseiflexaceae bacterium]|nr:hotdog fold thioesterase [Roseiflexaceae bacterium]
MPPDPDMLLRGLANLLGMALVEATPERVVATMPITPQHQQPFGFLHGGASVALAESVASIGGINANHVRPRRSGLLTAIGVPLHVGRTTQIWEVRISDSDEKLVCVSRCTLAVIELAEA